MEESELWIVVDNGATFEGTISQWQDVFFSNATKESIRKYCEKHDMKVEFKENRR